MFNVFFKEYVVESNSTGYISKSIC